MVIDHARRDVSPAKGPKVPELFFLGADDADTATTLMDLPRDSAGSAEFWKFVRGNSDSVAARTVTQVNADAVMALSVEAAEGELVNEAVTLTPYP